MRPTKLVAQLTRGERLNFLLTNRIPRRWATLFMGRFSKIENPIVSRVSIAVWRAFGGDFDLHEARQQRFASMHDLFTRDLKPGARPVDPDASIVTSPCDAIVGAVGPVRDGEAFQAKGFPYAIKDLLVDDASVEAYKGGTYVTLRLRSNMYHRFHAPCDGRIDGVTYVSGDTWNVNPPALNRIERLFCKNERAVIGIVPETGEAPITLVAVAAILVASIRIHCVGRALDLRYRGPNRIPCRTDVRKGDELGYFEHGSTIIVFAPRGYRLHEDVRESGILRMGQPLLVRSKS